MARKNKKQARREFDPELDGVEQEVSTVPLEKIIPPLFAGIALILFLVAGFLTYTIRQTLAREISTSGRVVDVVAEPYGEDGGLLYYPVIEFALPDGTLVTFQLNEGRWPSVYAPGDRVKVRYDPQQPEQARIETPEGDSTQWLGVTITAGMGFVFLSVIPFVRWVVAGE